MLIQSVAKKIGRIVFLNIARIFIKNKNELNKTAHLAFKLFEIPSIEKVNFFLTDLKLEGRITED